MADMLSGNDTDDLNDTPGKRGRGPGRTTREDWITAALSLLISKGEESVKVLGLAEMLGTTRSSFYWFFKNRDALLSCLLDRWQDTNTRVLLQAAQEPAASINFAIVNINRIWVAGMGFDTQLDFAVRDWAKRSQMVERAVKKSDIARIDALNEMYQRHDFAPDEAEVRARVLYYTQVGYETMRVRESLDERFGRARNYMLCLSGQVPNEDEIAAMMQLRELADGQ